jgi:gliding motility-associated-like protein
MIKNYFYILLLFFPLTNTLLAQMVIGKPTLGFSQACANSRFNDGEFGININFSVSPSLNPSNQFIVEISDALGNFSSTAVVLYTSAPGEIKNSGSTVKFGFPVTTSGEKYQVRVRSTIPVATGQKSGVFAAYYKPQDTQFTINNSIPTANYCAGGSYTLSIDPNGNGVNNSPLQFPSLTYNWFKDNGALLPRTVLATASTSSYTVTQPGIYYVETNYGTCTSDSYSNRVEVLASTTNASATITSSQGNPFCPSQGATTLSVGSGNSYQWFKDDVAITGATSQNYQAAVSGKYAVKIDFGSCQANATIQLQEFKIASSINVPNSNVIDANETLNVTATTDATSPTYQWYLENTAISGATSSNYIVTNRGNYKVVISQNGSCLINDEIPFSVSFATDLQPFPNVPNIPNLISPNGDFINDTWIIPQEYVNGSNAQVIIISANGEIVLQTDNYLNDWPSTTINFKNINPVYYYIITTQDNKVIKGSITVIK